MKIVLTGGGTGGHLIPLVAVAKKIKEKSPDVSFVFVGPRGEMEERIVGAENIPMRKVMVGKFRRYFSFLNFLDFFKVAGGIFQAMLILLIEMPDAIFSKGGYASLPVVLVGWLYRIPIMIHESDAVPGVTNAVLGKFSNRVAVSYAEVLREFPAAQVVLTGSPLREDINQGNREKAREKFSLHQEKKVIFIWGGSQGSRNINNKILDVLPYLLEKYQIIHQTGDLNFEEVRSRAKELEIDLEHSDYHAVPFLKEELKDVMDVADLIISRAGATSIAEIAANAKPTIFIPLQNAANDHQRANAYAVARVGGCVVLEENNLGKNVLLSRISEIMESEELQKKLKDGISSFYYPDAADRIANGVLGMIK